MKKIIAFVAIVLLLSGCDVQKDLPIKSNNELPERVSSKVSFSVKETETKSSVVVEEQVDADKEVSVDLPAEKQIETESESLPEQNTSTPKEQLTYDIRQEEVSEPTASQTENISVESTENRKEAKVDEPKIETVKSIYDYEFDVAAIRQELIAIGTEKSLEVDSSLTPSDSSWGNPMTASKDFQGENLERALKDYIRSMPELITAYGGEPIQYFNIYAELIGDGGYRFYFLY